ncbi:MAG: formylglycine-generating enzyme family protein [bacterium]
MDRTPRRGRSAARIFRVSLVVLFAAALFFLRGGGAPQLQSAESRGGCALDSRLVPGGEFMMGTTEEMANYIGRLCSRYMGFCNEEWFRVEIPRRPVHLKPFCIDEYEAPGGKPSQLPLTKHTWNQAAAWCRSRGLRLCTEEEWEKACAGAEGLNWGFGEKYKLGACNIAEEKVARTGAFGDCITPYGIHDMNGNVAEWVADEVDVETAVDRVRKMRVIKGGSSNDLPFFTRCSSREFFPGEHTSDYIGFRCCSDINR